MNQQMVEQIVKEVIASMGGANQNTGAPKTSNPTSSRRVSQSDYPLAAKRPELLKSPTGKTLDQITLKGVLDGTVRPEDIRISPETLELQAQIADSVGRTPFARNLRRAAELIAVPDERILEIYNSMRPYRSTKAELIAIAEELENKYNARTTATLVREAAEIYEARDRLKKES